jgi:carbon storage regulator
MDAAVKRIPGSKEVPHNGLWLYQDRRPTSRTGVWPQERKPKMLVLSRKKNEKIRLGANIELVIVEIRGDKVRIGIEAPSSVPVYREEIYQILTQNKEPIPWLRVDSPIQPQPADKPESDARSSPDSPENGTTPQNT